MYSVRDQAHQFLHWPGHGPTEFSNTLVKQGTYQESSAPFFICSLIRSLQGDEQNKGTIIGFLLFPFSKDALKFNSSCICIFPNDFYGLHIFLSLYRRSMQIVSLFVSTLIFVVVLSVAAEMICHVYRVHQACRIFARMPSSSTWIFVPCVGRLLCNNCSSVLFPKLGHYVNCIRIWDAV